VEPAKVNAPSIRQATPNDQPQIKKIIDLSFPIFFRYFATHSAKETDSPMLVNQTDGAVCGFAKLIEFNVGNAKCGCILWIAVHPNHRRKSIALNLTVASLDLLKSRGAGAVFASTQRRNRAARATLGKAGFKQTGFLGLWRLFGWGTLGFYSSIWYAPGEIVYVHS
jgi:N-acetylglutamate synthase-like GNAT family acetyltransferase